VRVNLATDLAHVAALASRAVAAARYASLQIPADVDAVVDLLEWWATQVAGQLDTERTALARSGMDTASFQRQLEQGGQPDQQ
jgi:hypothetical protein